MSNGYDAAMNDQPSSYALTANNHRGMRNRHALPRAGVRLCCKAKAIYSILTVTIFGIRAELELLLVLLTDVMLMRLLSISP